MKTLQSQRILRRCTAIAATALAIGAVAATHLVAAPAASLPQEVREHGITASRDGAVVLSGHEEYPEGAPKSLQLWRGQNAVTLADSRWLVEAAFSPDSKYVATVSQEYTPKKDRIHRLEIWDVANGQLWREKIDTSETWANLSWSKDSKKLAMTANSGGWQQTSESSYTLRWKGSALIWDLATDKVDPVAGAPSRLAAVALSSDGKRIAIGRTDGRAEIWNLGEKKARLRLTAPSGDVSVLAWRPDGSALLTVSQYETTTVARLWNTKTGRSTATFKVPFENSIFRRALFSSNGKRVALQSDGVTQIWNPATRRKIQSVSQKDPENGWTAMPNFSNDGKTLILWSPDQGLVRLRVK